MESGASELISEAMEKVGTDGVITVEESRSLALTLDVVEVCSSIEDIYHHTWQLILRR